jgi:phosphatidylinositol glycan class M
MTYFVQPARTDPGATFPWLEPKRLLKLIHIWAVRLFTPVPLLFLVTSLSTFVGLTWLGVQWYGEEALEEGLLYHFSRVDHRHNYSMYWYWIYLAIARPETNLKLMGRLLLIPQVVLLLYSSLGIASHNLGLAMFVQTYLFVTHNKVITAQYFTWYLCLLPLCSDSLALTRHVQIALLGLGLSIVFWLGSAYCLEMLGLAVHRLVWVASVVYFFANVNLMGALLRSYKTKQGQKKNETYTKSD